MKLLLISLICTLSLFAEEPTFYNSSMQKNVPYELKKWESYIYKKGDKFYKVYTSDLFTGTGIWQNNDGIARIVIKKGVINGKYELFAHNGAILLREKYLNGKKHGLSEMWNNETKIKSVTYKDGLECDGWEKSKNADIVFKDCKKSGWEYLTDNSDLTGKYKKVYDSNDIINITALDQKGKEVLEINSKGPISNCQLNLEKWNYNYEKGSFDEFYKIDYTLRNTHEKQIKSVEGGLYFQDLVGNPLYGIALTKDVSITAMNSSSFSDNYLIDQFKQEHYKMKHMDIKDVQVELDLKKIIFSDNTELVCE